MNGLIVLTTVSILVLTGCGRDDDPVAEPSFAVTDPTTQPSTHRDDREPPSRRAIGGPDPELPSGVVVRWADWPGEGPGFELLVRSDGSVHYEYLGFGNDTVTEAETSIDPSELGDLDSIQPADLATGSDDCMPEVDGSAPALALTEFEVDFCYTNRVDHPLIELVQRLRADLEAARRDAAG